MMNTHTFASFAAPAFSNGFALSAALICAIGAQNMFVLRQGLRREHIGPIIAFCILADVTLISIGVAGLGAVLQRLPGLETILTLAGAAFLIWYGGNALRRAFSQSSLTTDPSAGTQSLKASLGHAIAITIFNPHVYLDTVLLVGAIGAAQPHGTQPIFVAGAGTASALWFLLLGYGARFAAPLFARPIAWRILDATVAATMLILAAGLTYQALASTAIAGTP